MPPGPERARPRVTFGFDPEVPRTSKATSKEDRVLRVSNLPRSCSWQDLKDHMRQAGDVVHVEMAKGGVATVEFGCSEDSKFAIQTLDGSELSSRNGRASRIRIRETQAAVPSRRDRSRSPRRAADRGSSINRSPVRGKNFERNTKARATNKDLRQQLEILKKQNAELKAQLDKREEDTLLAPGRFFDTHFHLDRMHRGTKIRNLRIRGMLDEEVIPLPQMKASVEGGILVFCDPGKLPTKEDLMEIKGDFSGFGAVMGIHPSYSNQPLEKLMPSIHHIATMLEEGCINGLGEFGFDGTKGGNRGQQEELVNSLLPLAKEGHPIVLHVRGDRFDKCGREAYRHCLSFMQDKVEKDRVIQLHSFHGTVETLNEWMCAFPNAYYSFSGMVQRFTPSQVEALEQVPMNRLLLETDSPYLSLTTSRKGNSPLYIGDIASLIAGIKGVSIEVVRGWTVENGKRIFQVGL